MTDREKLVEIVCQAMQEVDCIGHCNHPPCYQVHHVVDELISHGVTVKESQKPQKNPLTLDEAIEMSKDEDATFYIENNLKNSIIQSEYWGSVNFWLNKCVEKQKHRDSYGRLWRCWAKRPTEEERKAAEWE